MPASKERAAVVFVHGLAKKPPRDKHEEIWRWGLSLENPRPEVFAPPNLGIDLSTEGIPTWFTYYADVFYGEDYQTDIKGYYESQDEQLEMQAEGIVDNKDKMQSMPPAQTNNERRFVSGLEAELQQSFARIPDAPRAGGSAGPSRDALGFEIASFLPGPVKESIIKKAAMEAYYYLFDKAYTRGDGTVFAVRNVLRERLLQDLHAAQSKAAKVTLVSHSMGTMVAYDVLRNCAQCPMVDTLITLGSPLGIQEVQDELHSKTVEEIDFPAEKLKRWINIYDPLDPICGLDPRLNNDYQAVNGKAVEDIKESNWGSWRHTITHYLAGEKLRAALAESLGVARAG